MKTQLWAVLLVAFCTLLTASGQVFYKLAADSLVFTPVGIITNYYLWIGGIIYGTSALLFIVALRGGDLSVLYPVVALSFIWVTLLSGFILHEPIPSLKIGGIVFIIGGIWLIGVGSIKK